MLRLYVVELPHWGPNCPRLCLLTKSVSVHRLMTTWQSRHCLLEHLPRQWPQWQRRRISDIPSRKLSKTVWHRVLFRSHYWSYFHCKTRKECLIALGFYSYWSTSSTKNGGAAFTEQTLLYDWDILSLRFVSTFSYDIWKRERSEVERVDA